MKTPTSIDSVSIEYIKYTGTPILCVFGCLNNDAGNEIKAEMLEWITSKYDVIAVNQDYPGRLYEFPALAFAQLASVQLNRPILYLHTKGAFFSNADGKHPEHMYSQINVRKMWKDEFIGHYDWYLNSPQEVLSPFTSADSHATWWNGFVAKTSAWAKMPPIPSCSDRFYFEKIFEWIPVSTAARIFPVNRTMPHTDMQRYVNTFNG